MGGSCAGGANGERVGHEPGWLDGGQGGAAVVAGDPLSAPAASARLGGGPGELAALGGAVERQRRADLRRMKAWAAGLLLVAAAVYVLARRWEAGGAPGWVGYLRAAAEAGMVGGLADWFAVTALFRRPLGLPIPHTALIPTRKDALGRSLGDFVGANFLSAEVVGGRIRRSDVAGVAGRWLAAPGRAERVAAGLAAVVRGALGVLRDDDVQAVLDQVVTQRLRSVHIGPLIGRLLGRVVDDRAHARLVDLGVERAHSWLLANQEVLIGVIADQGPSWSPRFVDRRVARRVHGELVRITGEIAADPEHPARHAADHLLTSLAADLRTDPALGARVDGLVAALLERPAVREAVRDVATVVRQLVLELVDDPQSELRLRTVAGLRELGHRLADDPQLRGKVNGWLEDAATYVVTNHRDELTRTVTETVERWDAAETTRKIELQVGRDLQFIRINGTVVGSLAGLAIHTVGQLLL